jgi:hypothetical protein
MVNPIDRALGIVERTSAEAASGPWVPGMQTEMGYLWAATIEGEKVIAFETEPGRVAFGISAANLVTVRKLAAGFNIVVQVVIRDTEGMMDEITIIGPRGRMKKIFAFLGQHL